MTDRVSAPASSAGEPRKDQLAAGFAKWWQGWRRGAENTIVTGLEPAPSGFSNETWFGDLAWQEAGLPLRQRVVLRIEPQGPAFFDNCDLDLQYAVMQSLAAGGIAVPGLIAPVQDAAILGSSFYVMEFVPGKVASGRRPGFHGHGLFFDASLADREAMWLAAIEAMTQVHRFDWHASPLAARLGNPPDCTSAISAQLDQVAGWLAQAAALGPFPVIEQGLAWLRANMAEYPGLSLLWGDARPGNLIYQGTRVAAVLDWEMAGIGPPEFDLCYFLLADEVVAELNNVPRLAGLPPRAATIAAWEGFAGRSAAHLRHAEIFAATRFAALMALVVRLTPAGLDDPRALLTDNVPTRRLASLLAQA